MWFGFRQQYSTSHALINITENMRKALDDGNTGCETFLDLQKAFDTVDHQVLLAKLNHYGICEVSNDWFKSYLSNRNQYVSINGYEYGIGEYLSSFFNAVVVLAFISIFILLLKNVFNITNSFFQKESLITYLLPVVSS